MKGELGFGYWKMYWKQLGEFGGRNGEKELWKLGGQTGGKCKEASIGWVGGGWGS